MDQSISKELFERARRVIPGGVNSPVRAFRGAHVLPPFIVRGEGAYLHDEDGHRYVDYVGSWGPLILGHAHPAVLAAIAQAARDGTTFGAPTRREVELAELLIETFPSVEMVRLVSSGTEATMSAVRLARGATSRDKLVKFIGCYHGHGDAFLIQAGSGLATHGTPSSPGVPPKTAADTLTCEYNDLPAVARLFEANAGQIAAVIVEPVAGNMGCALPEPGYLEGLRDLCTRHGAVLIFDEVMTGLRAGPRSAQGRFGIAPDLTTMGKVVGGGLPLAAYGGRRDLMEQISPVGPIYQAGTLSGNPLAVAAGLAVLRILRDDPALFGRLEATTRSLCEGMAAAARAAGVPLRVQSVGSMGCAYFADAGRPIRNFADAVKSDSAAFYRFHAAMLQRGVYLAPSPFEAFFVSAVHGPAEVERTLQAAQESFKAVVAGR
jgi:glutamate-1-semialdehyde 2,1-aminomutase